MVKSLAWIAASAFVGVGAMGAVAVTHQGSSPSAIRAANLLMAGNAPASPSDSWSGHGGPGLMGNLVQNVAQALNLSTSTVTADLKAGQSLATIAQNHGSSASALEATLLQDAESQIQHAVSTGHLTASQASHIEAHLSTRIDHLVTATPGTGGFPRPMGRGWGHLLNDAAQALNLSTSTVTADLKAGQSLATIAQNHGSSASALEATLLQDAESQIQHAVSTGHLTASQASQIEAHLSTRIDHLVTATRTGWAHPMF